MKLFNTIWYWVLLFGIVPYGITVGFEVFGHDLSFWKGLQLSLVSSFVMDLLVMSFIRLAGTDDAE